MKKRKPKVADITTTNQEVYPSMKAVVEAKGIKMVLLKAAKRMNAPGFHASNRVIWDLLGPWLQENMEEVRAAAEQGDDMDSLRKRKLKGEAERVELEVQKLRDNLLNRDDVKEMLRALSASQSAILKTKLIDELPVKLVGKSVEDITQEMTRVVVDTIGLFKKIDLNVNS